MTPAEQNRRDAGKSATGSAMPLVRATLQANCIHTNADHGTLKLAPLVGFYRYIHFWAVGLADEGKARGQLRARRGDAEKRSWLPCSLDQDFVAGDLPQRHFTRASFDDPRSERKHSPGNRHIQSRPPRYGVAAILNFPTPLEGTCRNEFA
jgi:hypothetical protein